MYEKLDTMIADIPFAKLIGIQLTKISKGECVGKAPLSEPNSNPYGGMHGGCIFALADTIAGLAACTYGFYVTTVDSNIHYLRPVSNTGFLTCHAKVVRQGKQISVYDVALTDDNGILCATATFTYFTLDQKIEGLDA